MRMKQLTISSHKAREVIDITAHISRMLPGGDGMATSFIAHTTAAVTTADLDPGMEDNMLKGFWDLVPKLDYRHHDPEHTPSHILSSMIGTSTSVPYAKGQLLLGTWQRIVLIEFDGPKDRNIFVNC